MSDAAEFVTIDLERCARCGGKHLRLSFKPFLNPPDPCMTHYALCPTNGEPVMMNVTPS